MNSLCSDAQTIFFMSYKDLTTILPRPLNQKLHPSLADLRRKPYLCPRKPCFREKTTAQ